MSSLQLHEQKSYQPREKRLKVSRACFTCRVKKIKCDGIQPCMQCKARQRPCSFSKDGTVDNAQPLSDPLSGNAAAVEDYRVPAQRRRFLSQSPRSNDSQKRPLSAVDGCQPASKIDSEQNSKEQVELSKTLRQLEKLSMMRPGEGKEGLWLVDINMLFNGAEEAAVSEPAPPSTASLNLNSSLLSLFFRHRHSIFPILPKTIFYRLLEHRDPLITPLLLNSMYCNAAHFSLADAVDADNYYKKAQALLAVSLDTPNLSLIISLCLLSTFESNRHSTGPHTGRNTARIYRDMAFRMCYDLKLHKRYGFHNSGATLDDIELRKRVYWVCYCLDKVQSLVTGKPCLLSSKDIDIDFPVVLGTDDTSEFDVNTCFVEHIKLMQISERVFEMGIADLQNSVLRSLESEQMVLDLDGQLLNWLRNLPQQLQWTPVDARNDMIPTQPPSSALIAHLHLVFNFLEISVLQPIASTSLSSSPRSLVIHHRCASAATNLTQLACSTVGQLDFILSFSLMAEALMAAVRVHIMNCADVKISASSHARFMFQHSLRCMRIILHHRVLDHIQEFATTIEKALVDADRGNNSSSRNSSPKMHVLSPIIPRTTAPGSLAQKNVVFIPVESYPSAEDRWSARVNNSNGQSPFGLVSPASSTASGSLEKSVLSRDEDIARSHSSLSQVNTVYTHITAPNTSAFVEPCSRPASFHIPATSPSTSAVWRSSPTNKDHDTPSQNQEQQQMEMYSNIWSRTSLMDSLQHFSPDHLDNSFINSTRQHIKQEKQEKQSFEAASAAIRSNSFTTATNTINTSTEGNQMSADSELHTLWDQNKNSTSQQQQQQVNTMLTSQPQTTAKYGLGVYASAQQHHTDVIRQHMPNLKSNNSNRPVLLNHHGQVVVAGATHDSHSIH